MNDFIYKFDIPFDKNKLLEESHAFDYEKIDTAFLMKNRKSENFNKRSFLKENMQ